MSAKPHVSSFSSFHRYYSKSADHGILDADTKNLLPDIDAFSRANIHLLCDNSAFGGNADSKFEGNDKKPLQLAAGQSAQPVAEPVKHKKISDGTSRSKVNWKRCFSILVEKRALYFQSFLPRIARKALSRSGRAAAAAATGDLLAEETHLVVLLVDISGFTGLCDRFQGLGQQGIDLLTASLNRIFGVILAHIDAWGGDVVKFDGDALIVVWEPATPGGLAEAAPAGSGHALAGLRFEDAVADSVPRRGFRFRRISRAAAL